MSAAAAASSGSRVRNPNWRDAIRQEDAPALWQKICTNGCAPRKAIQHLEHASEAQLVEARAGSLGIITPVIRAAASKGKRAEPDLLVFVTKALQCGFLPDKPTPLQTAWEVWSPPLVTAAAAGFVTVCAELVAWGASPGAVDSDGDTAVHAAIEQPEVMAMLLATGRFAACARAQNRFSLTPLLLALSATPVKPAHHRTCTMLVPHASLSDDDWHILCVRRRVPRLLTLVTRLTGTQTHWSPQTHWSFPASDRFTLIMLYQLAKRGNGKLPPELWAHVFTFVSTRGWFFTLAHTATSSVIG